MFEKDVLSSLFPWKVCSKVSGIPYGEQFSVSLEGPKVERASHGEQFSMSLEGSKVSRIP